MNLQLITRPLAELASLSFQERYVIDGTIDRHVLDVELLENVEGLQSLVRQPEHQAELDEAQRSALEDLFSYLEAHSGEALAASSREESATLIRESQVWSTLRAKAAAALRAFGTSPDLMLEKVE